LERKKTGDRILSKIMSFVETFINGMTNWYDQLSFKIFFQ
jgi:hypothetical protein